MVVKGAGSRGPAINGRIDNFLTARSDYDIVFQNDAMGLVAPIPRTEGPGFGGQQRKRTRKWRRKRLESLKTDSEMASGHSRSRARRTDQANFVLLVDTTVRR